MFPLGARCAWTRWLHCGVNSRLLMVANGNEGECQRVSAAPARRGAQAYQVFTRGHSDFGRSVMTVSNMEGGAEG